MLNFQAIIFIWITPWAQDVNWTYIRRSEDAQGVFWTPYVRSIYVLCPGCRKYREIFKSALAYLKVTFPKRFENDTTNEIVKTLC